MVKMADMNFVQMLGHQFVREYYSCMCERPNETIRFYNQQSYLTRGSSRQLKGETAFGLDNIGKVLNLREENFIHARIQCYDCQLSANESIVIQVIGELYSQNSYAGRRFVQTFVLAKRDQSNYFVLNDVFRYLLNNTDETQPLVDGADHHVDDVHAAAIQKAAAGEHGVGAKASIMEPAGQLASGLAAGAAAYRNGAQASADASGAAARHVPFDHTTSTDSYRSMAVAARREGDRDSSSVATANAATFASGTNSPFGDASSEHYDTAREGSTKSPSSGGECDPTDRPGLVNAPDGMAPLQRTMVANSPSGKRAGPPLAAQAPPHQVYQRDYWNGSNKPADGVTPVKELAAMAVSRAAPATAVTAPLPKQPPSLQPLPQRLPTEPAKPRHPPPDSDASDAPSTGAPFHAQQPHQSLRPNAPAGGGQPGQRSAAAGAAPPSGGSSTAGESGRGGAATGGQARGTSMGSTAAPATAKGAPTSVAPWADAARQREAGGVAGEPNGERPAGSAAAGAPAAAPTSSAPAWPDHPAERDQPPFAGHDSHRPAAHRSDHPDDRSPDLTTEVFVGNIPDTLATDDIRTLMQDYGAVRTVKFYRGNKPPHYAFVAFESREDVEKLMKNRSNVTVSGGQRLNIDYRRANTGRGWVPRPTGRGSGGLRRGERPYPGAMGAPRFPRANGHYGMYGGHEGPMGAPHRPVDAARR